MVHHEIHKSHRIHWLRASVLGANDGIVSTASLIIGVAAANASQENILLAGIAGLVSGAMSMAAGEYVSVCSQSDTIKADLEMEKRSLEQDYDSEKDELAKIYESRGVEPTLAIRVAEQLMTHDALAAHARDDIGISTSTKARPFQAALYSACAFSIGATLPLLVAYFVSGVFFTLAVALSSLVSLAFLGGLAAQSGGASIVTGASRVVFWGIFAMALSAAVGRLFGILV